MLIILYNNICETDIGLFRLYKKIFSSDFSNEIARKMGSKLDFLQKQNSITDIIIALQFFLLSPPYLFS